MLEIFKKYLRDESNESPQSGVQRGEDKILLATSAILIEVAKIDGDFSESEQARILATLAKRGLTEAAAKSLMKGAADQLSKSIDLWSFTNEINEHYTEDERKQVLALLWEVVYADGTVDAEEELLMRRLTQLLRLHPKDFIAAKLTSKKS